MSTRLRGLGEIFILSIFSFWKLPTTTFLFEQPSPYHLMVYGPSRSQPFGSIGKGLNKIYASYPNFNASYLFPTHDFGGT